MPAPKQKSLRLYSTEELSELFDIPEETLKRWRKTGYGPKSLLIGKHRRYRECDVREWLDDLAAREPQPV
jgi:DNA-binding transcriptional MerR regulator